MKTFKQIKLILLILAVLGLSTSLTSCQKSDDDVTSSETTEDTNPSQPSDTTDTSDNENLVAGTLTLGVTLNSPQTKCLLDGTSLKWCSEDQLKVYYGETSATALINTTFTIEEKDSYTNKETFSGEVNSWDKAFDFYVVYPVNTIDAVSGEFTSSVSTYDKSASTIKFILPSSQLQKYNSDNVIDPTIIERYDYKFGSLKSEEPKDSVANITLTNLMTILDINITKPAEDMQIKKVVVRAANDIFPTEYDYSLSNSTGKYVSRTSSFTLSLLDSESNPYTSPASETSIKARFVMCPFSVTTADKFYIDVYAADKIYTLYKKGLSKEFEVGLNSIDMILDSSTEVKKVHNTANSYMMTPSSMINIPVNVRGNGGDVANTELSTSIAPASVGILWETSPDLISLSELSSDTTVTIAASSELGNSVIAAYSGENQTGEILWSWHIWVTDYDPAIGDTFTVTNSAGASYTFMDRNLGATTAKPGNVSTIGLFYQWGRKDPFPSSASLNDEVDPTLYNAFGVGSTEMVTKEVVSATANLQNTILYPLTYYKGDRTNSYDWYSAKAKTHNTALWGGADISAPTEKTIFDPCPAGWRVPAWKESASPWGEFTKENFIWSDANLGRTYTDGAFYPADGYSIGSNGGVTSVGKCGHYWTASYETNGGHILGFSSSTVSPNTKPNTKAGLSSGMAIRCVKE